MILTSNLQAEESTSLFIVIVHLTMVVLRTVSGVSHMVSLPLHSLPLNLIVGTVMQVLDWLVTHLVHSELLVSSVVTRSVVPVKVLLIFEWWSSLALMLWRSTVSSFELASIDAVSSSEATRCASEWATLVWWWTAAEVII